MSCVQMYLEMNDIQIILEWLNNDPQIAFFKPVGPQEWIAVKTTDKLSNKNSLWHIPYEKLPLVKDYPQVPDIIEDPWRGWVELRKHKNSTPYFGTGCPGIIDLDINVNRFYINEAKKPVDAILISSFGWIGNHYQEIGRPALKETEIWWRDLKEKIEKVSQKIILEHPDNVTSGRKKTIIYAFPHALKAIESGKEILNQPWPNIPQKTYEKVTCKKNKIK